MLIAEGRCACTPRIAASLPDQSPVGDEKTGG